MWASHAARQTQGRRQPAGNIAKNRDDEKKLSAKFMLLLVGGEAQGFEPGYGFQAVITV